MLKGFKDFLMRGNVVDLAVAVVIGAAFGKVVTAIVEKLINPLVAAVFGKPDLSNVLSFKINNADFSIGAILNEVLNFVFVAAAIYFVIVVPMNKLAERRAKGEEAPAPSDEVALLTEIRDSLRAR
jgi:large conductance mechanosensitive channel